MNAIQKSKNSIFNRVDKKLSGEGGFYSVDQAHTIVSEIRQLQNSLSNGEQEKQSLMQVIN